MSLSRSQLGGERDVTLVSSIQGGTEIVSHVTSHDQVIVTPLPVSVPLAFLTEIK